MTQPLSLDDLKAVLKDVTDLLVATVTEFGCWTAEDHPKVIAARTAYESLSLDDGDRVERVARAICQSKDLNPDCLYQHNFEGDWPEDDRRDYADPFTGEPRTMLFHKAWRRYEKSARAAISAMPLSSDGGWQPIETAPKDGTRFLAVGHRVNEIDIVHWGNGRYLSRTKGWNQAFVSHPGNEVAPTHWMPLPSAPIERNDHVG